jgi:hypothetical protein
MQATNRPRSIYCFTCLCGKEITSERTETECPWCARLISLIWPAEIDPPKPIDQAKPLSAAS